MMIPIKSKLLNSAVYYIFVFFLLGVLFTPFNLLNIKIENISFQYLYFGLFVSILVVLSFLQYPIFTNFDKWLIFLVLGLSASLITSIDRIHTIRILTGFFLKGIAIAFITERISKNRVKTTNIILIVCASLVALLGIIEFSFGWRLYPNPNKYPLFAVLSTIGNQLPFAAYLILFFPLSILYFENKKSIITFLLFLVIIVGVIISFSRSGWFALFLTIGIYFLRNKSLKKIFKNWVYIVSLVFVIVLAFSLMSKMHRDQFKDRFSIKMFSSRSFEHRLKSYVTTKNILKDYPFFGVGFGNYPKVHEKYMVEGVVRETPTPDNMYLRFLCDTGIVGTATFFIFIIFWLFQLWKNRNNVIIWAIFCGMVGFLINMLAADLFLWTIPQFAFWMLFGLGVNIINGISDKNR